MFWLAVLAGYAALAIALLSDTAALVRTALSALAAMSFGAGYLVNVGAGGALARVALPIAGFGAVVAVAAVMVQLSPPLAVLALALSGMTALALIAMRAHRLASTLGSLPGTRISAARVGRLISHRQLAGVIVAGLLGVGAPLWLDRAQTAGVAILAIAGALGVAAWRAGVRPTARQLSIVGAAAALALVPFRGLGELSVGGIAVGLSDFALGLGLLGWLLARGYGARAMVPRYALALGAFVTWLSLTSIGAYDHAPVLKEVAKWAEIAIAVALLADVLREARARAWVMALVFTAVLAQSLLGLFQIATGFGPGTFSVGGVIRAFGTFDQPNPFGGYLGLHAPLLLAAALCAPRSRRGWLAIAAVVVIAAIVASRSRGAWLGFGMSTLVLVFAAGQRTRLLARTATVVLALGIVTIAVWQIAGGFRGVLPVEVERTLEGALPVEQALRITVHDDYAVSERAAQWTAGWRMFLARPLFGIGAGNFDDAYMDFLVQPFEAPLGHAHNVYLNMGSEAGLPGLIAIVGLTVWLLWRGVWIVKRARGTEWEWIALGTLGASVAFAVHNLVDSLFVNGMGLVFALLIATTYVVEWAVRPTPPKPQARL